MKKEALLYKKAENQTVDCLLCAHNCSIAGGKFGICGVRKNISGSLFTYAYGEVIAAHVDPIEKKPLYHFLPGSTSFSIATPGCNFRCGFCQNWEISQTNFRDSQDLRLAEGFTPEAIVQAALKNNCQSISYTYTEPTIFFEYALDTAQLAKEKGLYNIFVTNGYMTKEALKTIKPYLDAANVDLKFFKDDSYAKICGARLKPVLDLIKLVKELGIWIEVTTLVVPGENDSQEELKDIAEFIASVDKNIPWHVSRFHPDYKFTDCMPTPEATLKKAGDIGHSVGLKYVYIGNVYGFDNDTFCPECKKLLIKREIFQVLENRVKSGKCTYCSESIAGLFD